MAYCNKCQTENLDNAKFCRECGAKLTDSLGGNVNTIVCIKCDHLNPIDTKFCEQCGAKIIVNAETKLKSVLVSAILEDHAWTEDAMNQINEGLNSGMMKSEAKQIFLEAEKRKNNLMKILKDSLKKTKDKDLIKLINDRVKDNEGELKAIK
ncbi:zinc ribbon domain-containing protein [Patescibacteria group bacterium]|nr:zinc ribbon domain-containing protein [Patescibacteria group bacterium]